jgi:hypothetical protein
MRDLAAEDGDWLVVLDFTGEVFQVDPVREHVRKVTFQDLAAYGPFQVTKQLMFPNEQHDQGGEN